jgi:glycosyltransferase involved in cell wall biosynthesis
VISLLNIGSDATLLDPGSEAARRQRLFARELGVHQTFVIRCHGHGSSRMTSVEHGILLPCRARHWSLFPILALRMIMLRVRHRVDVVLAQDASVHGLAALLAARCLRRPLLVSVFGDEIANDQLRRERYFYRFFDAMARAILDRADAIRTDSREMAIKLRSLGFGRVIFIPFLITDEERYFSLARPNSPRPRLEIIIIARLEIQKNIGLALRALASIRSAIPVHLTIVGDGSQRPVLVAEAARLRLDEDVTFSGQVPYDQLPAFLERADIFLLTSNHETSARVLVMAAMSGMPTVATRTMGAAEIIEDGHSGFIVDLDDEMAICAALQRLADPSLRERFGSRARAKMRAEYSRDRILRDLGAFYHGAA